MTDIVSAVPAPARGPLPHERCPHCGSLAVIEPSSTLRFVCGVCGKARVPIDDPTLARRFDEAPVLARATAARNASTAWAVASSVAAAFSGISLLMLLLVVFAAHPPLVAELAAFAAALTPLVFAVFGFSRSRARKTEIEPALEEGWSLAARDLAESLGTVRPEALTKLLRVSPDEADRLLARLSTDGAVRSRVLDEGSLEFEATNPHVRVVTQVAGPMDVDAAAEAEAQEAARKEREASR